ncbi:hypothetical protein Htur_1870 [Haloterrigena turkmenica DSM 5511]|uniref:Uncharacterized protein n=1 Tax=Haloterrigena turkmenica (strain ATCC 51198 / DSM 5511 / JCM 9101 / NCIMB 13204 / VKM B-1734 / 4k) TaxID=543526 RepID=D2RSH9_HALTV|nr:hypothetical protein [Haloterrigena turkmenica]ADB60755.1 hypothetical protein Htur_1870 [Haloterrigena turkmenica DSM 5511]
MDRSGFVKLAVAGIGLVVLSFFVRGFGQLVLGRDVAELLQAPFAVVGFLIVVYLFVRATLDAVGVWTVENDEA